MANYYDRETKLAYVEQYTSGKMTAKEVVRELGCSKSALYSWVSSFQAVTVRMHCFIIVCCLKAVKFNFAKILLMKISKSVHATLQLSALSQKNRLLTR